MDRKTVFLNNDRGNVVLVPGVVYEVHWKAESRFPAWSTILRFEVHTSWDGGYVFTVLDKRHQQITIW